MLKIASAQNSAFKRLLSLTASKGLKKEGLFLLSGEKLVREFLARPNLAVVHELLGPGMKRVAGGEKAIEFSAALFAQLDVLGTGFNILVLEQPRVPVLKAADLPGYAPEGIEIVLPAGDPGNLGALLRSCEAFSVPRAILTQEAAHPFLPKAVKASAGSALRLPLAYGPALREFPATCIALDAGGEPVEGFDWPARGLLVVGEEGPGLSPKFRRRIAIPTQGVESLNVVVAASIALFCRARAGRQK